MVCHVVYHCRVSPGTPTKAAPQVSGIVDRNKKLKAYRIAKNTKKLIEMQEQRSPFILAVPTGRWVEKKEKPAPINFRLNDTPVRAALATERVIKKSTMKNLIAQSTAKKENVMVFKAEKKSPRSQPAKSKKKILSELNTVSQTHEKPATVDLNDTFEVLPDLPESPADPRPLRRSVSLPRLGSPKAIAKPQKASTPPIAKKIVRKEPAKKVVKEPLEKPKPVVRAVVKRLESKPLPIKPIPSKMTTKAIVKKVEVKKDALKAAGKKEAPKLEEKQDSKSVRSVVAVKKPIAAAVVKKPVAKPQKPSVEAQPLVEPDFPVEAVPEVLAPVHEVLVATAVPASKPVKPIAKAKEPARSKTYNTYKKSVEIQSAFLTLQLTNVTTDLEAYIQLLSDDDQTFLHKTVQQCNLIVSEKLPKFGKFLERFEAGLADQNNPKRLTDDDVENYWFLIYDEIESLKKDLTAVLEKKKSALTVLASQKKRRTRRTFLSDEGTPKRSRRIAENADTPKSVYKIFPKTAEKFN